MSSFVCSISGVYPEEPVISNSGYIFEKRLIEKYLKANGDVCPITGNPLTVENLTQVKVGKFAKPRPAAVTSIPGLLMSLQNEWDSLMTETFNLRVHLETVRKQLSHSLYQHDAACRVIARLLRERDNLREEISQFQREAGKFVESGAQKTQNFQDLGLSTTTLNELQAHAKTLLAMRKKRDLSNLKPKEHLAALTLQGSFTPHSSTVPGITRCLSYPGKQQESKHLVWTAGMDGAVHLFDMDNEKTLCRLHGHLKQVNSVACSMSRPQVVVTGSEDKTVRVWSTTDADLEGYKLSYILRNHTKAVTSTCIHPIGNLIISSSKDLTWAIHDLDSGRTLRTYRDLPCAMPVVAFHPDGMLIGACGMNHQIFIYDIKGDSTPSITLPCHDTPVTDLQFSENGYYLATASSCQGGSIKLWDLRKSLNFETIQPLNSTDTPYAPYRIAFDGSGQYLAVAGGLGDPDDSTQYTQGCLSIYSFATKTKMEKVVSFDAHTHLVTDASFGPNAEYLYSCSMDRTVKYWDLPQDISM